MGANASVIGHNDDLFIEDLSNHAQSAAPTTGTGILCFCRAADAYVTAPVEATAGRRA
ncbi:hypothetical protein [Streptomyces sp. TLI_171]|uniref:hypothetical protein n=1 Tax=Streptomyces sp. TLI_171 TaxID=1938859 RepID=UPI000C5F3B59|nr:hypothetical protein [Streptomyces sp. TLI_171]RKE21265.1 hypothetical protein BX266_4644 [Streptomyces sp. TLI_171]